MAAVSFQNAAFLQSAGAAGSLPVLDGREIVFCGRSNVGKSSLINRLCGRKALAKTSGTPGKTTTVNFFSAGGGVYLTDLPGYGYARRSEAEKKRWGALMEDYFHAGRDIALVLQLLDSRHDPSRDDWVMLDFLLETRLPFAAVLTKTDKLKKPEQAERLEMFRTLLEPYRPLDVVGFSVKEQTGAERLRAVISGLIGV